MASSPLRFEGLQHLQGVRGPEVQHLAGYQPGFGHGTQELPEFVDPLIEGGLGEDAANEVLGGHLVEHAVRLAVLVDTDIAGAGKLFRSGDPGELEGGVGDK